MSEDSKAEKVYNKLINKYNFQKDLLKFKPNSEDIKNKTVRDILSRASKKLTGKQGFLDIYYCDEKDKFLFLVEFKPEFPNMKKRLKKSSIIYLFFRNYQPNTKLLVWLFQEILKINLKSILLLLKRKK